MCPSQGDVDLTRCSLDMLTYKWHTYAALVSSWGSILGTETSQLNSTTPACLEIFITVRMRLWVLPHNIIGLHGPDHSTLPLQFVF
jgi:hypothetical protein